MTTTAPGICLAVKVAHARALDGFGANGVCAAVIDGPDEYGTSGSFNTLDQELVQRFPRTGEPHWFATGHNHILDDFWVDSDCRCSCQDLQRTGSLGGASHDHCSFRIIRVHSANRAEENR